MTFRALLVPLACALLAACSAQDYPMGVPLFVTPSLNIVTLDPSLTGPTPAPLTFGFMNGPTAPGVRVTHLALDYIGPDSDDPLPALSVASTGLTPPVYVPTGGTAATDVQIVTPPVLAYFQAHPNVGVLLMRIHFSGTTDAARPVGYDVAVPISRRSTPTP